MFCAHMSASIVPPPPQFGCFGNTLCAPCFSTRDPDNPFHMPAYSNRNLRRASRYLVAASCTGMFPILKAFKTFSPPSDGDDLAATSGEEHEAKSSSCCGTCSGCSRKGSASAGAGGAAGGGCGGSAATVDVEDLAPHPSGGGCCSSGKAGAAGSSKCCSSGTPGADLASVPCRVPLPEALREFVPRPLQFKSDTVQWFAPTTLDGLTSLQKQFASAAASTVKFVSGNTAYGMSDALAQPCTHSCVFMSLPET